MPPRPKPYLAALAPYPLAASGEGLAGRVINLASNENTVGPSEAVLSACRQALEGVNRYPQADAPVLRCAIAERHGLEPERIVCANGSSELISLLAHAYCTPGDEVLVGRHGFLFFSTAARIAGAAPVRVPSAGIAFDVEGALRSVTPRTRIVFVDSPGNPTGVVQDRDALERLHAGLPSHVLLVLDAAYAEFVSDPAYEPGAALVEAHDNCVMLRTFSKIYGLAGLRLGWAYAPAAVAGLLHRIRQPNNLCAVTVAAGVAALAEVDRVAERRRLNARVRDGFSRCLRTLGLEVAASHANFVLVRFASEAVAGEVFEALKRSRIIVRHMAPYGLPERLRITVGTEEEMGIVGDAIHCALA